MVLDDAQARRFAQGQAVRLTGQQAAALSGMRAGMSQIAVLHAGRLAGLARQATQPGTRATQPDGLLTRPGSQAAQPGSPVTLAPVRVILE